MPKEVIHGRDDGPDDLVPVVGWMRDGDLVQFGLIEVGRLDDVETGPWTDLTRSQVNRLISTLRRARDAAFGPDM